MQTLTNAKAMSRRARSAVRQAEAVLEARKILQEAQRFGHSYLSTGALRNWALDLASGSVSRDYLLRTFGDALAVAVRYQNTVLVRVGDVSLLEMSPEELIDRAIGSGSPFAAVAAMVEIAQHYTPDLARSLLTAAYASADWPLRTALRRVFPDET